MGKVQDKSGGTATEDCPGFVNAGGIEVWNRTVVGLKLRFTPLPPQNGPASGF